MNRSVRTAMIACCTMLWIGAPAPAHASCALCSCSVSVAPVAFGAINPLIAGPADATGGVTVTCGPLGLLVGYDLKLSKGSSNTYAARTMTSGARTLNYNLYYDAAHTQIWGDGTGASILPSNSFLLSLGNTSFHSPIYGRVPSASGAYGGSYSDTIVATIIW